MSRSRVKTLLILLLALANIFLLGLWISREAREYDRRRTMDTELERVLAGAGLYLSGALPDAAASVLDIRRDPQGERAAAEALLGPCQEEEMGGGIVWYTGALGSARFSWKELSEFEIELDTPRGPAEAGDIEALAREMALLSESAARLVREPDGYAYIQERALPVWGETVRFELDGEGRLTAVRGFRLPDGGYTRRDTQSRSAGWALLSLARALREENLVPLTVRDMELGYRPSALTPETARLTPYWRVTLERGETGEAYECYVNAVTGAAEF